VVAPRIPRARPAVLAALRQRWRGNEHTAPRPEHHRLRSPWYARTGWTLFFLAVALAATLFTTATQHP
jgi:hypothetical protein